MTFPLMSLPVELQARVIYYMLIESRARPSDPDSIDGRVQVDDFRSCPSKFEQAVFYNGASSTPRENSVRVLLVSRQINAETRKQLSTPSVRFSYDLDVMLNTKGQLLPTWTCVPHPVSRLENLNMTFRLFGRQQPNNASRSKARDRRRRSMWQFFMWRASPLFCSILSIVTRIVALGASPPKSLAWRDVNRQIMISRLNIDIERTCDTCKTCPMWGDCPYFWDLEKQIGDDWNLKGKKQLLCVMHPELFVHWFISHIKTTLLMGYDHYWFGDLLYNHVGSITFSLEGTIVETLDLGLALAQLPRQVNKGIVMTHPETLHRPQHTQISRWAETMLAKRESNGLARSELHENESENENENEHEDFWGPGEFDLFDFARPW